MNRPTCARTRLIRLAACLSAGVFLALCWGCRPGESKSADGQAGAGAGAGDPAKPRLAGIVFQEDQFFRMVEYGMKHEAGQQGVELMVGNSFGALDKEISMVDTYIARGVAALVISPLSIKASIPALRRAHERGIKVITFDSHIEADFPAANIKSDQVSLGALTGGAAKEFIAARLGGQARVAMIEYMSLAPETCGQRVQGFREGIKDVPGIQVVAEQDAWLAPKATEVVESLLTAHPEINVIWAANEGGTVGAVTAVRNAGKSGKVWVFGTDMSTQIADFLLAEDQALQAVTGQKPYEIGEQAVRSAMQVLRGEPVEKQVLLPGLLFTREARDKVVEYQNYLKQVQAVPTS